MKSPIRIGGLVLICLLLGSSLAMAADKREVTFTYDPPGTVDSVHLVGDFNGWSTTATPMRDEDGDGVYEVTLHLASGNYGYKYLANGNFWVKPPNADEYGKYGYGKNTGIIKIGVKDKAVYRADGQIVTSALKHNKDNIKYVNLLSREKRLLRFKFRTRQDDVEDIILCYDDGEKEQVRMERFLSSKAFDYYRATIKVDQDNFGYQFKIKDGGEVIWYTGSGIEMRDDLEFSDLRPINYVINEENDFSTPDWVKGAVFYQIFPDRFYNGNPQNDPQKVEIYKNEDTLYEAETPKWDQGVPNGSSHVIKKQSEFLENSNKIGLNAGYHIFYGGDLQGVEEKISYLNKLGINAVYFNPLFESVSNTKYDTAGHQLVDDNFAIKGDHDASEEYLEEIIKKLHEHDIKVVFDVAFNYTGYEHWAFQDVVKNGKSSRYSDWYFIDDYPVTKLYNQSQSNPPNYKAWWGFGSYPVLNLNNPEVEEYLFKATRKWMDPDDDGDPSDGIDGWRLNLPKRIDQTNPEFIADWRELVKEINPNAYITGEVWENANQFFQGDKLDAVMNYQFRKAVLDFIGRQKITADTFASRLTKMRFNYPEQSNYALQNLIGSHDTKRFLTAVGGNKAKLKLASFLQLTYPGAPLIYYGDEVGMKGGSPPDSRRSMVWEDRGYTQPDDDLFNHYQKLIELRRKEPALTQGTIEQIPTDNSMVYCFKRAYKQEKLLILLNAGSKPADIDLPVNLAGGEYKDLYSGKQVIVDKGNLKMDLKPSSGAIIKVGGQSRIKVNLERNAQLVVRGTMNNWGAYEDGTDIVMEKQDNGTWKTTLTGLEPGKTYRYKYVLKYKETNTDIGEVGPEREENFEFTAQGNTHTLITSFTKRELEREHGWFTIEKGSIKLADKTVAAEEVAEVNLPTIITADAKYHAARTIVPRLNIRELNEITVKLDQLDKRVEHTFTFDPSEFGDPYVVDGIWIKGSFDAWQEHKLTKKGDVYKVTLNLHPGTYNYVFFDKYNKSRSENYKYYPSHGREFTITIPEK